MSSSYDLSFSQLHVLVPSTFSVISSDSEVDEVDAPHAVNNDNDDSVSLPDIEEGAPSVETEDSVEPVVIAPRYRMSLCLFAFHLLLSFLFLNVSFLRYAI